MTTKEAIKALEHNRSAIRNGIPPTKPGKAIEAIDFAIAALERDRWISVEEALPEPHTRVIGVMAWKSIMTVEYQNGHWYNIDHLEHMPDEAVTHWRPLPLPPKEEA